MNALLTLNPHAGAHRVALRAALSVVVPFLALYLAGHTEWSIYAAFGAFTSVYARNAARGARLRMQSGAAVILVASVALGTLVGLLPTRGWMIVPVAAVWAMFVALASDTARWAPPGPLFAVFAVCSVASIPSTPAQLPLGVTVAASSALFALLLGQLGRLRPSRTSPSLSASAASATPAAHAATPAPAPAATSSTHTAHAATPAPAPAATSSTHTAHAATPAPAPAAARRSLLTVLRQPGELLHISRFGIAAAAAGTLSTAFGIGHPYWAIVAAIVPLVATGLSHSLVRGIHRILGTAAGLLVAALLLLLEPSALGVILMAAALQALAELFIARNYALALLFVTPLALLMVTLAHPTPAAPLLADRAVETLLGTLVALAVALTTHLATHRRPATVVATSRQVRQSS